MALTITVTHAKISAAPETDDATLVQPSDWNANHIAEVSGDFGFVDDVVPTGTINGSNQTFVLPSTPDPVASLKLYYNGVLQRRTVDYTIASSTITTLFTPQTGDDIRCDYRT